MKKIYARREPRIPFTKEGYQKILDEQKKLLSERPEAVDHLKKARDMGDLSENGYYKASRQRLTFLDGQLKRLERLIRLAVIVQATNSGTVQIGSHIKITDGTKEYEYSIVGGYESDPSKMSISHISPLGKALMGKRTSETVVFEAPSGKKTFTILEIS